ncbi:FTR1 family protein [sulfur-oxidizing endosymbiont of Gigantopelta aegis]|uniref:FTR1 family protein n=1 Tax=sulfur-oxidizing endosymbiont of Gigantopelta aegis TaxID=2794934 RepID=UPI0018DAFD7D|nr:FTR1 family protein [sulfur-oxidizing endosymbiont of Gigantopelta aegis]
MLLSSVIIVLREVLEAALLFSILIALSKQMSLNFRWLVWSLSLGVVGAMVYGTNINIVSDWFEGVGQEVINALIQFIIYFMLVFYMVMLTRFFYQKSIPKSLLCFIMSVIISMAVTREGAEIILYFFSVTRSGTYYMPVVIGMTIGASIGVSVGLLFYYLLSNLKLKRSIFIGLVLLLLVSSGMVSQASLLLIQADWLPGQLPLWNTSNLLSEQSVTGQLLYALIGYESTPTAIQASLYLIGFLLPIGLIFVVRYASLKGTKYQLSES